MTTDWGINVNQINRKVTGDFVITEPHGDVKYLDFEKFYNELSDNSYQNVNKYLKFFEIMFQGKNINMNTRMANSIGKAQSTKHSSLILMTIRKSLS